MQGEGHSDIIKYTIHYALNALHNMHIHTCTICLQIFSLCEHEDSFNLRRYVALLTQEYNNRE